MPTKQETFDTVVRHLRRQGCRADDPATTACCYRIKVDGRMLMCAVGCLIPDAKYDPYCEGRPVCSVVPNAAHLRLRRLLFDELGHNEPLVRDLQSAHDNYSADDWEDRFRGIAEAHELAYRGA